MGRAPLPPGVTETAPGPPRATQDGHVRPDQAPSTATPFWPPAATAEARTASIYAHRRGIERITPSARSNSTRYGAASSVRPSGVADGLGCRADELRHRP